MGQVKEIKIKNETYYFFDHMIDTWKFQSNLLKIDKKSHRDIDIDYISYIKIKKCIDCENIPGVNPLYLIIHSYVGSFKEKKWWKYLIIDSREKYEEFFSGIKSKIETLNIEKELFYEKNYALIGINSDDDLPLNNPLKFPALAVIIRCIF